MWKCQRCKQPVYFAERRQSLGFDWHRPCLRCEECDKVLNPGQHAERKGSPYCHVPCYSALFGPELFGHGARVESHKSYGHRKRPIDRKRRKELERRIEGYNNFVVNNGSPFMLSAREVNDRLIVEGILRIFWGVEKSIRLREFDDNRVIARRRTRKSTFYGDSSSESMEYGRSLSVDWNVGQSSDVQSRLKRFKTFPAKLDQKSWEEMDDSLITTKDRLYHTVHSNLTLLDQKEEDEKASSISRWFEDYKKSQVRPSSEEEEEKIVRGSGPRALRRRNKKKFDKSKLRRRSSMNGHWYDRDTSVFTPPKDSVMTIRVSSLNSASEVIKLIWDKYQIESDSIQYALLVVKDTGERRIVSDNEIPMLLRLNLGPQESISRLYIADRNTTDEINHEVAQYIKFAYAECRAILNMFYEEEEREVLNIRRKYERLREAIKKRRNYLKFIYYE